VTFAWIFFRAPTIDDAGLVLWRIATTGWGDPGCPAILMFMVLAVWVYQLVFSAGGRGRRMLETAPVRVGLVLLMIGWLLVAAQPSTEPFIYFQF
jgi:hypothetical protein